MVLDKSVLDGHVVSPALVGRGGELSALLSTVAAPPAVAVIEGEAGIGKTRLVNELRNRLDAADRWFVTGCCRRIREPFPLGPVLEAVRGLGDDLAGTTLSQVAGALRPLVPELADVLPPQPPPLGDRAAERHRAFRALVEVFGSLGPVVVVLEDLHWADEQTIDFVSYLLADPPPKLSLVLTFRVEEVDPAIRALAARLPSSVNRTALALRVLDREETGAMAAAILGTDRVSEEFAEYLHERSSGLPFAIEELLALLRAQGTLARQGGSWARRTLQTLDVPAGIRSSVLERVRRLPANSRSVVEAAAVLQSPMAVSVVTGTSGVPETLAASALEAALNASLLVEDGDRIGFRHLLAAQTVYEEIPGFRRRELHSRAASQLEALRPSSLGLLAHHLRQAGRLAAWVGAAERAADQALELGHDDETVRLLEEVLRHAPLSVERRGAIAVKLARAAVEIVDAREAVTLLLEVPTDELAPSVRSELRFWLALLLDQSGSDPLRPRQLLTDAVEELDGRPELKAWAMIGLGVPTGAPHVPLSEHLQWLHRSLAIVPDVADQALEVLLLGKVAMVLVSVGDPAWRPLADRVEARTAGSPTRRREANAYLSIGIDACYVGHHEAAHRLLTAGLSGAVVCESRQLELRLRAGLALLDYCRGSWDGLSERAELLVGELADQTAARMNADIAVGCLALARGELEEAEQRLADVVRHLERAEGFDLLPIPVAAQIRLATARGDAAGAVALGQRLLAGVEAKGIWVPAIRGLPPLAHATVADGDPDRAHEMVERVREKVRGLDAPLALATVRHAQGFLAAGRTQWRDAADHFRAAADHYDRLACPYEAAQAREEAGACLFADGDAHAETTLRIALKAYRRLGATWDAARAARIARRHGMALPATHRGGRRGYGDKLSPREREVAQMAADGLTNEEIARNLFLSPKTVDKHVGAALRKLGVHSRRSLPELVGDLPGVAEGRL